MVRTTGLGGAELRRNSAAAGSTVVAALVAAEVSGLRQMRLAVVGAHPLNPPDRVAAGEEMDALIEAVKQWGVLEPLLVVPVDAIQAEMPDYDPADGVEVVVVDGHRRYAAATAAGVAEVPVVVRQDLAADATSVMLVTDAHKRHLTPVEQAHAFQRLIEQGMTQVQIATRLGIAQGTVSKRLALLRLPASIQQAVQTGALELARAQEIAAEPDDEILAEAGTMAADAVSRGGSALLYLLSDARNRVARRRQVEVARQVAEAEAVPLVESPQDEWGHNQYRRQLTTKSEIAAARTEGALAVAPASYGTKPLYYRTGTLPKAPKDTSHQAEARDAKAAQRHREQWLTGWMGRVRPTTAQITARLVQDAMHNQSFDAQRFNRAARLLNEAGVAGTFEYSYWSSEPMAVVPERDAPRVAWLLSLLAAETSLGDNWAAPLTMSYVNTIIEAGYSPTEWENKKITAAQATVAAKQARTEEEK